MEEYIRLHNMVKHTKVLGPGSRAAIWFQGCKRSCPGCMSEEARSLDGGKTVPVSKIVKEVLSINDIEGVTISGGEPFLQIRGLYALLKAVRDNSDLSVIIYTGNTMEQLRQMKDPMADEIISGLADIIIDGEYVDEKNDGTALKGSSNQTVNFITPRYLSQKHIYEEKKRSAEIIATEKDMFFIGIPSGETLEKWKEIRRKAEE